jgi:hypothetical protein
MKIARIILSLIAGILLLFSTGCTKGETTTGPTAQLSVFINGQGSVTPEGGAFKIGEKVTIKAVPEPGWIFMGWKGLGDNVVEDNPLTVIMDSDKDLILCFNKSETNDGTETTTLNTGNIESATSLQFVVEATAVNYQTAYSLKAMYRVEDIGTGGMKLRIDIISKIIDSNHTPVTRTVDIYRFLFDRSQQKALMANIGRHLYSDIGDYNTIRWDRETPSEEISGLYSSLVDDLYGITDHWKPVDTTQEQFVLDSYCFNDGVAGFQKHLSDLSQWTSGTWTSADGLVKVQDIQINPVFTDSIFTTEEATGGEAPSTSGTNTFTLNTGKIDIKWTQDLLDAPTNNNEYSWPVLNFNYTTGVPAMVVLVPPKGRWYSNLGYGLRNVLADLTDNFGLEYNQTGSNMVRLNYYSDAAPLPGTYEMMAYSLIDGTKLWEKAMPFTGPKITITNVEVKYWDTFWSYPVAMYWPKLVAISISNSGDLPGYGYNVRAWTYETDWADKHALHMMDGPAIKWIGTNEIIWENWNISQDLIDLMPNTTYTVLDDKIYFTGQGVFNTDGFGGNYINTTCDYWDDVRGVAVDAPKQHQLYIELADYLEETSEYILADKYTTTTTTPGVN